MDRRTKFILFIILALVLFGLVGWFIVWPTLRPLIPERQVEQPPALGTPNAPVFPAGGSGQTPPSEAPAPSGSGAATFDPGAANPDAQIIADLSRRAGVLAERAESGSSQDGFQNFDDAQLGTSPTLASLFNTMKNDMRRQHPAAGPSYVTTARRLVEIPESDTISGPTFNVKVQLQVQTRTDGNVSSAYREATVTFTQSSGEWLASGYVATDFTP